jgi:hypothetical protein
MSSAAFELLVRREWAGELIMALATIDVDVQIQDMVGGRPSGAMRPEPSHTKSSTAHAERSKARRDLYYKLDVHEVVTLVVTVAPAVTSLATLAVTLLKFIESRRKANGPSESAPSIVVHNHITQLSQFGDSEALAAHIRSALARPEAALPAEPPDKDPSEPDKSG